MIAITASSPHELCNNLGEVDFSLLAIVAITVEPAPAYGKNPTYCAFLRTRTPRERSQ